MVRFSFTSRRRIQATLGLGAWLICGTLLGQFSATPSGEDLPPPPENGPVVAPPANPAATDENSDSTIKPPIDSDGRPAKVFQLVTVKSTDAYVGQSIPLRIEFFIRMDVMAQQDSLPTLKGSDFLMNNVAVEPPVDEPTLMNEVYHRETWSTAISSIRSGNFLLQLQRDTYWEKTPQGVFSDPLGNLVSPAPSLEHATILSNSMIIHAHPLPEQGRPGNFTGAIGEFRVEGHASPTEAVVGEPVYLEFNISGEGSFDRIQCPGVMPDPAWKNYASTSRIEYVDEAHLQGAKTFRQALIPQKSGLLPLPAVSFSYFNPAIKTYITTPIRLPSIRVTGSPLPVTEAPAAMDDSSPALRPSTSDFAANHLEFGSLRGSLVPLYQRAWFWTVQGTLVFLVAISALALYRSRLKENQTPRPDSMDNRETAMREAVARDDAPAFFLAAKSAVQEQLGTLWKLDPSTLTLRAILARDPALGEKWKPLFTRADEVMYSGKTTGLNLSEWERRVREELHRPPA